MLGGTGSSDQDEVLLRADGLGSGPSLSCEDTLLTRDARGASGRSDVRTAMRWRHSSWKTGGRGGQRLPGTMGPQSRLWAGNSPCGLTHTLHTHHAHTPCTHTSHTQAVTLPSHRGPLGALAVPAATRTLLFLLRQAVEWGRGLRCY